MRTLPLLLMLLLFFRLTFAQSEKEVYKNVVDKLEGHYNDADYDAIFAMFSTEMQNALPLQRTTEFFSGLKSQAGKLTKREFMGYQQTYATYKAMFEWTTFTLNVSVDDDSKINGLFVKPFVDTRLPKMERNATKLRLPFREEWTVIWGGDTRQLNYHVDHPAQKNAFDLVITASNNKSYKTDGKTNEDYFAFGKEILAPCEGEVVLVVDGVKDNKPGEMNPVYVPGNTVIVRTPGNEYLFFAHFKQGSIKVKQGQKVTTGQVLGLCGNSGNSSEPHLHFHIQNDENMTVANGVKCYFDSLVVNGQLKSDYSPVQKDKIKPE